MSRPIPALIACCLALALAGCAARVNAPAAGAAGATDALIVSGLAVTAPRGADWMLARRTDSAVVFARTDGHADHRWTAWVQTVRSPAPIDGYFQLARVVDGLSRPRDSGRFRDDFGPVDAVDSLKVRCLARSSRVSDHGPAPQTEDVKHVIQAHEYFCRHPADARLLVLVHVSERDAPQARFDRVTPLAQEFFAGVRF